MRRLGKAVRTAVFVGMTLVPGVAFGQTTTSTTSTTSSTTTTAAVTTSTTLPHPCLGRVCTAEPPGVVLSTASMQIVPDRGSYCWRLPPGSASFGVCRAAGAPPPGYKAPLLVVTRGEVVTVRFTAPVPLVPDEVALVKAGERLALLAPGNPTQFRADLPPGLHENVWLASRWIQGDVQDSFRLEVRPQPAPTTPTTGRKIALTG